VDGVLATKGCKIYSWKRKHHKKIPVLIAPFANTAVIRVAICAALRTIRKGRKTKSPKFISRYFSNIDPMREHNSLEIQEFKSAVVNGTFQVLTIDNIYWKCYCLTEA